MASKQEICVVLSRPKFSGNVGAIARVMKNFGLKRLLLINPRCRTDTLAAKKNAKHAQDVLKSAKKVHWGSLEKFDLIIATTAKNYSDYNIPRLPLSPREAAKRLCQMKAKTAILFGPEDDGLMNSEIMQADFCVKIPASKSYPTLNLSQSVAVFLYEIFMQKSDELKLIPALSAREKSLLQNKIKKLLKDMDFKTIDKRITQERLWKRLVGKGFLSKREGYALFGFFEKIQPKNSKKR